MGLFSMLFKKPAPAPKLPAEARIVRQPNGIAVDLLWVPADHPTVLAELRRIYAALYDAQVRVLIWVMPPNLLDYYLAHETDELFGELCHAIGLISLGRNTVMLFTKPPPARVRTMLEAHAITASP